MVCKCVNDNWSKVKERVKCDHVPSVNKLWLSIHSPTRRKFHTWDIPHARPLPALFTCTCAHMALPLPARAKHTQSLSCTMQQAVAMVSRACSIKIAEYTLCTKNVNEWIKVVFALLGFHLNLPHACTGTCKYSMGSSQSNYSNTMTTMMRLTLDGM